MEPSTGVMSWEVRGIGVSVITGLGSGDLSIGFSSKRSWWIQRSGGFRSLELPLYLWDPLADLQAARFLEIISNSLREGCGKHIYPYARTEDLDCSSS